MNTTFNLNNLNAFLQNAQKSIACDQECQRNKTEQQLKEKYDAAQTNLTLADPQYQVAKRNYYTYVSGQSGYNDMMEKEWTDKASMVASTFKERIQEATTNVNANLDTYNGILINYDNLHDLYAQYLKENQTLAKQYKESANDVLTNERKTYYEDQQIHQLNKFYRILWVLYIVAVLCFFGFSLLSSSHVTLKTRLGMGLFFVVLPFFSTWLLGVIVYILYALFSLLPKNVYL
jgi:hypothetical protein